MEWFEESLLSQPLYGGGPPRLRLQGDNVTHLSSPGREPRLLRIDQRSPLHGHPSAAAYASYSFRIIIMKKSFMAGAGFHSQLVWFCPLRRPISASATSTWMSFKPRMAGGPLFVEFIAPADCSSWELCLRLPLDLGEKTSPWRPADVAIADLVLPCLALSDHVDFLSLCFGDTRGTGRATKLYFFALLDC